jgi:hypothetical protein
MKNRILAIALALISFAGYGQVEEPSEFDDKAAYLQKKYPKGSAMEKRLEDLVKPCIEEAIKAAMEN